MKFVFMGTPDFAVPTLKELVARGHEIGYVLTKPDAARDRGKKVRFSPVKEAALSRELKVLQPQSLRNNAEMEQTLKAYAPDYMVVVAYGKLLPPSILDIPRGGCINLHGSLLPRWRGAAPLQWTILSGDKTGGVTLMKMDQGLDTGNMLASYETPVSHKNIEQLHDELAVKGARLLVDTLEKYGPSALPPGVPQQEEAATYAPMITKEDGCLDFSRPAIELERKVRGFYGWPGAYTTLKGKIFKIWESVVVTDGDNQEREQREKCPKRVAGTVLETGEEGIAIACGKDILLAKVVQAPGKRPMVAGDYLRGNPIEKGTILG